MSQNLLLIYVTISTLMTIVIFLFEIFFILQISHVFKNGRDCIGGFYRQNLLWHTPIKVLYSETAKDMREMVLVG